MQLIQTPGYKLAVNTNGDESSPKLAILMPGRLDTKDYVNFTDHAVFLSKLGYFVVVPDPPFSWDSPGELANYTTSNYLQAVHELIDHFGNRETLLLGHSRGGAVAMLASTNKAVKGLVLINAAYGNPSPPRPEEIQNGVLPEFRDLPPGNVRSEEKIRFDLPMTYFEDGAKHDPLGTLKSFSGAKLLVHATRDEFTKLETVKEIYASLTEPKMFLEIDCTHDYRLFPEVIKSLDEALGQFVSKYL